MTIKPLPSHKLCALLSAEKLSWANSDAIPRNGRTSLLQPRALKALDLALSIKNEGYNVYLSGTENTGRKHTLCEYLEPHAKTQSSPPDLVYVNNFDNPDHPVLLTLPTGQGRVLRDAMHSGIANIRREIAIRFEQHTYLKRRNALQSDFQTARSNEIKVMESLAEKQGFSLDVDDQGALTLYPLTEGTRLSEEEFSLLNSKKRQNLKRKGDALMQRMACNVRNITDAEKRFRDKEHELDRGVVGEVLNAVLNPLIKRLCKNAPDNERLELYFTDLRKDILNNTDMFLPRGADGGSPLSFADMMFGQTPPSANSQTDEAYRYAVNVFVDNSATRGAPLIVDDHPIATNLLGCIERESEMGALVTDFTLIKAGTLHKANGGFLVLRIDDILQHPVAWDGLLRSLRAGMARFDDNLDALDGTPRTKGIEPDPVPLSLKVFLIGNDELYEVLFSHEPRFSKLFKMKAQLTDSIERNTGNIRQWLRRIAHIIDENGLLPFDAQALAGLVDFSSSLIEDQRKISLEFPVIRDVMIETHTLAVNEQHTLVTLRHLDNTLDARKYRSNLVEELYMEEYDRDLLKISVDGQAVGRINALTVASYGQFAFGLPHRISCTVGVGHGGIIDLEREAELGGPIHTKAMLILKSYLTTCFAQDKPLVLTGSLCFEQNYGGIEGDSASGAELAALLSALSGVPLKLCYAVTGAVSQSGQIMAVGGVTQKVEGFFNVCARRGLTGQQGVLLPADNIEHLMLPIRIREAVDAGQFAIYPVQHISDILALLTDIPVGRPLKNGGFTKNSLCDRADKRLQELGYLAEHSFNKPPRRRK